MEYTIKKLDEKSVDPHHLIGFIDVYQEAFLEPPWEEHHRAYSVHRKVWLSHLPHCLVIALNQVDVIGLGCAHPVLAEVSTGGMVKEFLEANRETAPFPLKQTIYMSELAVEKNHRKQGVGNSLIDAREDWARANGFTHYAMRTAQVGSKSAQLYLNRGARLAEGLVQIVEDDTASPTRVYYWGEL